MDLVILLMFGTGLFMGGVIGYGLGKKAVQHEIDMGRK